MIDSLYEELILLDEVYGELDDESNCKIQQRRIEICKQLAELENQPNQL